MFGTAEMNKVKVFGLSDHRDKILTFLQEEGVVQIKETEIDEREERTKAQRDANTIITRLNRVKRTLTDFREEESSDGILSFSKKEKQEIKYRKPSRIVEESKEFTNDIEEKVEKISENISEVEGKIDEIKSREDTLHKLKEIDFNLNLLDTDLDYINKYIGHLKTSKDELMNEIPSNSYVKIYKEEEQEIAVVVSINSIETSKVLDEIDISGLEGKPKKKIKELEKELDSLKDKKDREKKKFKDLAEEHFKEIEKKIEILENEVEKGREYEKLGKSQETFALTGWIPEKKVEDLKRKLEDFTNNKIIFKVVEHNNPEEEIQPTLLENNKIISPFELITKMFGVPKPDKIDPTPLIAISFPLFFGFMLTDAMYGLILALMSLYVVYKWQGTKNKTYDLFAILIGFGIFTMGLGAIFGSYFGNLTEIITDMTGMTVSDSAILSLMSTIKQIEPIGEGSMTFLGIALIVGITHILIGNIIGLVTDYKRDKIKAVLGNLSWILLIFGIAIFAAESFLGLKISMSAMGYQISPSYIAIGLALIMVLGDGLYEFGAIGGMLNAIDIFGFLGDWFSYARLMALGLATAGIAMVINLIVELSFSLKVASIPIGIIFGILIFIGGHVFNLLINSLGAFVHALRLHYVEFFGQFYDADGEEFEPFESKRKLTKLKFNKEV